MKKYILGLIFALTAPLMFAYASTPVLTATGSGDNNTVTVQVTGGEINAPVVLFYNQNVNGQGTVQQQTIGTTDINGRFTGTVSSTALGISMTSPVYVQVGGYQSLPVNWPYGSATSTNIITFSPSSPTFAIGQNGTVTISGGGGGTYYIASNSNPNFTSASISGSTLTLNGSQSGQSSVTVCSTSGPCAVLTPNFSVSGSTTGATTGPTGSPTVSASTLNISQGGQGTLTLSGGTSPYLVTAVSGSNISTTLIGNTLYVNGSTPGTSVLNICSTSTTTTGNTLCTPVTVNVQGQGATTTSGAPSFTIPLTSGEPLRLLLSGGNGTYYIQPMGSSPVMASLNGSLLTLTGSSLGSATVNVCSSATPTSSATCLPIMVTVNPSSDTGTGGGYLFDTDLSTGMSGQDVMELQQRLKDEGYLNVTPTGYFGPLTFSAVKAYQSANGLPSTGYVGPLTRGLLNQ